MAGHFARVRVSPIAKLWDGSVVRERETKLLVDPAVSLPPVDELLAGCGSWTTEVVTLTAVYFDTPDLRLTRSGVSLRFRSDDGWTVKLPEAGGDDEFVRTEHAFGNESGDPPDSAREMVSPWARSEPLAEVARVETRRDKTRILAGDGRLVCEIDDDEVHGFVDGATPVHFREIEVETPEDGDAAVSRRVVKRLRTSGAGTSPGLPKIVRVLGESGAAPRDLAPAPHLDRHSTTTDLVRASISTAVQSLIQHDALVRDGEDPEGVHRARVATRRLRSHLHAFRRLVDEEWSESLCVELQWLGAQLGHVRDADVLLGRLETRGEELWEGLRPASRVLTDRLRAMRDRDRAALLDAMHSPRYIALLDDLIDAAQSPPMRDPHADALAKDVVHRLTRRPSKRLRATVKALPRSPSDAELHVVRQRAKRTRYAYEAVAPIIGKTADRTTNRLSKLQGLLGDHHDATVAIEWLHSAAIDEPDAEVAFVAGAIAQAFADDQQRVRDSWKAAWRRVEHDI